MVFKKFLAALLGILLLLSVGCQNKKSTEDKISYKLVSLKDIPEQIRPEVSSLKTDSDMFISGDEPYLIIIPGEKEEIEITSVERDINSTKGVNVKYKVNPTSTNTELNSRIKVLKFNEKFNPISSSKIK